MNDDLSYFHIFLSLKMVLRVYPIIQFNVSPSYTSVIPKFKKKPCFQCDQIKITKCL